MKKAHELTLTCLEKETKQLQAEGARLKKKMDTAVDVVLATEYSRRFDSTMRSIVFNLRRMNNIKRLYNETYT